MSLGIVFKGPEGIVLAADSRVTLGARITDPQGQAMNIPATYDNATKLLRVVGQTHVGVVTYGAGAIGQREVRTAHSFLPEFEDELEEGGRLSVQDFANRLSDFFKKQWSRTMPKDYKGPDMVFLIGGYDDGAPYGKVFEVGIPSKPVPQESSKDTFGITWGGQREFADRLLQGFDAGLPAVVQKFLKLSGKQVQGLGDHLKSQLSARIPYQFLPLQDCIDLSIFLIRATIMMQTWLIGIRGVGGAIDVATITRTVGFEAVQQKTIVGERAYLL